MILIHICLTAIVLLSQNVNSCGHELKELRRVMVSGKISQRRQALKDLSKYNCPEAFTIASLEYSKEDTDLYRLATNVLCSIQPILAKKFIISKIDSTSDVDERIDILFGLSDRADSVALEVIKNISVVNEREKTVKSFIYCSQNIDYQDNYDFLISTLMNKKNYIHGNLVQHNACIDAASLLGKLGDNNAIKYLKKAAKWADGYFGEEIMNSIIVLEKKPK